jgi:hypothetical protein
MRRGVLGKLGDVRHLYIWTEDGNKACLPDIPDCILKDCVLVLDVIEFN